MGVQELKHAAQLREWSARIAECRGSGMSVREWCKARGIITKTYYYWEKQFVTEASQQLVLPGPAQSVSLIQVNPETIMAPGNRTRGDKGMVNMV